MLPSLRFVIYFAAGALSWIVAAALPGFLLIGPLYIAILLVVATMDLALSPRPVDFDLERLVDPKMNLGTSNVVKLRARSRASAPVDLTIRDEPPSMWPVSSDVAPEARGGVVLPRVALGMVKAAPWKEAVTQYEVTPTRRGAWEFGALSARYPTRLGLWHRQFRREARQTVHVYPDTSAVRRFELSLRNGRLRDIGIHLARLRGKGTDFESLRDYSSDDNYKDINWKASARRGRLISTNYEVERDQTVVIALDCGRMMTALATHKKLRREKDDDNDDGAEAAPTALSKLDCAINATVLLAHISASMGDAVGLLLFADSVLAFVPPRKGRTQTGAIIEALYAVQPALVEPDYAVAYHHLMGRKIRRSLVVTFTDLIDADASSELIAASGSLRRHHNPLCVTINNRDVMDLAATMPESADDLYSKAMAQRMLAQRQSALLDLQRRGVGILDVESTQLTVATVNRYLDLKARAAF